MLHTVRKPNNFEICNKRLTFPSNFATRSLVTITWCKTVRLSLNIGKCKVVMSFYRTWNILNFAYCLDGQPLLRIDKIKDLGFLHIPSLDFRPHIDFIACKALRVIGFIRRHCQNFSSKESLLSLYNALVRSLLEYGSSIWSIPKKDILQLDKVQNRYLDFAGSCLNITHPPHDYGPMNAILKLEPLSERRNKLCINFTTKLLEGFIDGAPSTRTTLHSCSWQY